MAENNSPSSVEVLPTLTGDKDRQHVGLPFWQQDISVLYRKDQLSAFVPKSNMSLEEKLNALVRFCCYAGIMLFAYNKSITFMYLPLIAMLITKLMYDHQKSRAESMSNLPSGDIQNPRVRREGGLCVPPTADNPFMNVSMSDYRNDPDRPAACAITDPDIKISAKEKFTDNLFRDVNDVYGRTSSERQFYTMPSTTIPNRQDSFMQFCYGDVNKNSCKQGNMQRCVYEDIRANRRPPQVDVAGHRFLS